MGALIISQIQIAAMRRAALPEHARAPFPLYIDEFQNYTSDDPSAFQRILTEARKYNLRLVLAHQYICQINRGVAEAIFGAVGTMISFRVGVDDANYLQKVFGGFTNDDLQNLSIGEAICRSGRAQDSFSLKTYDTYDKPKKPETDWTAEIIEHSRTHYGVPIEKDEKHGQRGSEKWLLSQKCDPGGSTLNQSSGESWAGGQHAGWAMLRCVNHGNNEGRPETRCCYKLLSENNCD